MRRAEAESFYKNGNRSLSFAMRPVYHRKAEGTSIFAEYQTGNTDTLLFHDGVKWTIAKTTDIKYIKEKDDPPLGRNPTDQEILQFFETFHTMYGMDPNAEFALFPMLPHEPNTEHCPQNFATIVTLASGNNQGIRHGFGVYCILASTERVSGGC